VGSVARRLVAACGFRDLKPDDTGQSRVRLLVYPGGGGVVLGTARLTLAATSGTGLEAGWEVIQSNGGRRTAFLRYRERGRIVPPIRGLRTRRGMSEDRSVRYARYVALLLLGTLLLAGCGKKESSTAPAKEQSPSTQQKSE
jgi:hypothetical protein